MALATSKLDLRTATGEEIAAAMRPGSRAALLAHKAAGLPVAVWDYATAKTVWVAPEDIPGFTDETLEIEANGGRDNGRDSSSDSASDR